MAILFAALPSQDKGSSEELRAQAYLFAMEGVSAESVDAVVRDVLRGAIPSLNPTFAPTPPEMSRLCREWDAAALRREASPPPAPVVLKDISDEERQRITAKFAAARQALASAVEYMDVTPAA